MPIKPKSPCKAAGCKGLAEAGKRYCPLHSMLQEQSDAARLERIRKRNREYKNTRTDYKEQRFYSSKEWQQVRAEKLKRSPLCEYCYVEPAVLVHHVVPIKQGGDPTSASNLKSICQRCHNRMHKGSA